MKTVSDYQAKGVVFVEGDVVRHSEQQDMRMAIDGCNRGQCGQSVVESFAWRTITGAVPQHGLDGNMLVEIAFYNNHRDNGVKQMSVGDIQWGLPTVNKAWRPIAPAQQPEKPVGVLHGKSFVITGTFSGGRDLVKKYIIKYGGKISGSVNRNNDYLVVGDFALLNNVNVTKVTKARELGIELITFTGLKELIAHVQQPVQACCSACNHEWTTKQVRRHTDDDPCPQCGAYSAQQPLVHVGAELVFDTTDVVIVAETTVDICIHIVSDDSLLAVPVTQSHRFSPRKPPEQVELEADLITFLKGIDEGVLITGAKDVEFLATEFIKAGYRKG